MVNATRGRVAVGEGRGVYIYVVLGVEGEVERPLLSISEI